jgi:hypothetical protein
MSEVFNFGFKAKAAAAVFVFCFTIPLLVFDRSEKFIGDKKPVDWLVERGWWGMTGVKLFIYLVVFSLAAAALTYGVLTLIERLIVWWKKRPMLEVTFKDEPPYTEHSGPSGNGFYYYNCRIGVKSSVAGKATVKVPTVKLENDQVRSNVALMPADNQLEELDAGDPGYWRAVQWNTSEGSIKLVHKGKDSYYLGPCSQFEILVKCGELAKRQWVTTRVRDEKLLFDLSDEADPSKLGADVRLKLQAIYEDWNMPVEGGATTFDHVVFIRFQMVSKLAETNVDFTAVMTVDGVVYVGEQVPLDHYVLETHYQYRIGVEPATVRPVRNDLREIDRYLKPGVSRDGWIGFRFNSVQWPNSGRKKEQDIRKRLKLAVTDGYGDTYSISAQPPWPWDSGEIKPKACHESG